MTGTITHVFCNDPLRICIDRGTIHRDNVSIDVKFRVLFSNESFQEQEIAQLVKILCKRLKETTISDGNGFLLEVA